MKSLALRRILAVLAAAALVAGALVLRHRWDQSSTGTTATPGSGSTVPSKGGRTLACVTDLAAVCNSLASATLTVRVEDWTTTVASLGTATAPDGWVTFAPLDTLGTWGAPASVVASSELVAVAKTDRNAALTAVCTAAEEWKCIGTNAGGPWTALGGQASWGKVLPGIADPNHSAIGVLSVGTAAASFLGTSDFGSTQLDASDLFFTWYQRLIQSIPAEALSEPLTLMLQRPSAVAVVATTAGAFAAEAGARANGFASSYPGDMARADVVLAERSGSGLPADLAAMLTNALKQASWSAPGAAAPTRLPSAATLVRLQQLWKEIRT